MKTEILLRIFAVAAVLSISVAMLLNKNTQVIEISRTIVEKDEQSIKLLSDIFGTNMTKFTTYELPVTLTAYTASEDECNSTPEVTASNTPSRVGVIALSRDLFEDTSMGFGSKALLFIGTECIGLFEVEDRMSKQRHKGTDRVTPNYRRVDILHGNKEAAKLFGVKENGKILWIND